MLKNLFPKTDQSLEKINFVRIEWWRLTMDKIEKDFWQEERCPATGNGMALCSALNEERRLSGSL